MKLALAFGCVAGALLMTSPTLAQTPAAPPAAAAPAAITDQDVANFGKFLVLNDELKTQGKGSDQAALAEAVQKSGLTVESYNQIATQLSKDPELTKRVQQAYGDARNASQAQAAPAAPGAAASATATPTQN